MTDLPAMQLMLNQQFQALQEARVIALDLSGQMIPNELSRARRILELLLGLLDETVGTDA
jgi:hypothetical protein